MLTIINITRGHVDFEFNGKRGVVYGEALLPDHAADYVLYEHSLSAWSQPFPDQPILADLKRDVLEQLVSAFAARGMRGEVV